METIANHCSMETTLLSMVSVQLKCCTSTSRENFLKLLSSLLHIQYISIPPMSRAINNEHWQCLTINWEQGYDDCTFPWSTGNVSSGVAVKPSNSAMMVFPKPVSSGQEV